jgi:hypothetical protein
MALLRRPAASPDGRGLDDGAGDRRHCGAGLPRRLTVAASMMELAIDGTAAPACRVA